MAMFAPSIRCLRALRAAAWRDRSFFCRLYSVETPPGSKTSSTTSEKDNVLDPSRETRATGPRFLNRPLGLPFPPHAGQNSGVDERTLRQRRDDFVNHDKHLERRQNLAKQLFRPYFKDFNDMRHFKGKVFFAPERIFKAQFSGYFPNLRGYTLSGKDDDTTNVLQGKVSIVALSSSRWAENQVKSFCDGTSNPGLVDYVDHLALRNTGQRMAQFVEINWEPNVFKHWIIKLFKGQLKASRDQSRHGRYFIIHKGFNQELRQAVGMFNQKVGYVYLVDEQCRIRWAGHAQADPVEKESMIKALGRLLAGPKASSSVSDTGGENPAKTDSPIKLRPAVASGY